jgi:hypothetical protein
VNRLLSKHGHGVALVLGVLLLVLFFYDGRWGFIALAAALIVVAIAAGSLRAFTLGPTRMSIEFWKQAIAEKIVERTSTPRADKEKAIQSIASASTPEQFVDRIVAAVERGEVAMQLRIESISLSATQFRTGQTVVVSLRATASPFEIESVTVCYGRVGIGAFHACPAMTLSAGTARDGTWTGSFELDQRWPSGEWTLQEATIRNAFGSASSIDPGDWTRQGGSGGRFVVEARV